MAHQTNKLPKWLRIAVGSRAISLQQAYLMHWHSQQPGNGWVELPRELWPAAEAIWLLNAPAPGVMQ